MASIYQQLVSKYGDDALRMINKLKSGAKEVVEDVPYPKNIITQDALAEKRAFEQVGKPYSTDFSMVPEGTDLPAIIANKTPAIVPEVLSAESKVLRNIPAEDYIGKDLVSLSGDASQQVSKSNLLRNTGIGAAGLGAGALMLSGNEDNKAVIPSLPVSKTANQISAQQIEPEKSVAKSQITGKASVVDNALTNKAPEIAPVSSQEDTFNDLLSQAHQQDAEHNLLFGMLKAAQMGGSALAGTKADTSFADAELLKDKQHATQIKTDMDVKREHEKITQAQKMEDPNSDISKQARALLGTVYPELLAKYPNISASELEKQGMNIGSLATAKENAKSRELTARIHSETLANSKQERKDKDNDTKLDKRKKVTEEVENFRTNIEDNVERALELVKKSGTFELLGPQAEMLSGIMDEIATDMAKLQDPSSIARPSEVRLVRKNLIPDTKLEQLGMNNSTATKLLKSFRDRIQDRANNAYKVRGVPLPSNRLEELTQSQQPSNLNTPNSSTVSDLVTIRSKKSGIVKKVSRSDASRFLSRPDFEQVQ